MMEEIFLSYAEKIKTSMDPMEIGELLDSARNNDEETAIKLLKETKDSITEKITASTDLEAIGMMLERMRWIDKGATRRLLKQTKDSISEKIRACNDQDAKVRLLDIVGEVDDEIEKKIETEDVTKPCIERITDDAIIFLSQLLADTKVKNYGIDNDKINEVLTDLKTNLELYQEAKERYESYQSNVEYRSHYEAKKRDLNSTLNKYNEISVDIKRKCM